MLNGPSPVCYHLLNTSWHHVPCSHTVLRLCLCRLVLLGCLQANAADILTAIAHTQPSALATQLMQQQSIQALFSKALQPGSRVLVTALDVCAALLEPRRALDPGVLPGAPGGGATDNGGSASGSSSPASSHAAAEAITSMLQYLPQLMQHLRHPLADISSSSQGGAVANGPSSEGGEKAGTSEQGASEGGSSNKTASEGGGSVAEQGGSDRGSTAGSSKDTGGDAGASTQQGGKQGGIDPDTTDSSSGQNVTVRQETPYGVLQPPLGRARLRIVELLAVLLRVGDDAVDAALIQAQSLQVVQELVAAYPFNNLLHHQMFALLLAVLRRASPVMVSHLFGECQLVTWLLQLPQEVSPAPRPGSSSSSKVLLRAGYLGHVTRIGQVLQEAAAQQQEIADVLQANPSWPELLQQLAPRFELEDVTRWQCGRPTNTDGNELDSDGDEFPVSSSSMDSLVV